MNLMKLAARGPAPWASEPPRRQRQPLSAAGGPASRPVPPPTCSVTVVTRVPSKLQRGLQILWARLEL